MSLRTEELLEKTKVMEHKSEATLLVRIGDHMQMVDMEIVHHFVNIPIQEVGSREALKDLSNRKVSYTKKQQPDRIGTKWKRIQGKENKSDDIGMIEGAKSSSRIKRPWQLRD